MIADMDEPGGDVSLSAAGKTWLVIGLVASLVPFVMSSSTSSSVTINGQVVESTYRDNIAIAGGAVALVCGVLAAVAERKPSVVRSKRLAMAVGVILLGAYQLARGFGAV
jgi:hypothetical protein